MATGGVTGGVLQRGLRAPEELGVGVAHGVSMAALLQLVPLRVLLLPYAVAPYNAEEEEAAACRAGGANGEESDDGEEGRGEVRGGEARSGEERGESSASQTASASPPSP